MTKRMLTQIVSEPLDGARNAAVAIDTGTGNLTIDPLSGGELLATGTLEYLEGQDPPVPLVSTSNGKATLSLKAEGGRQASFRMPWSACNGETNWLIHLNPAVLSNLVARSGGGNIELHLEGMNLTDVVADTGGGNVDIVLPGSSVDMSLAAKSGAGNVTIQIPSGRAARIHARTGLGKVIVDPGFPMVDQGTYQSPDYDHAAGRVEVTANSGAGNVTISCR